MDGAAVRLEQGRRESVKVYDRAPWEVAARFAAAGATRIHVVDLDAAFTRGAAERKDNRATIARIAAAAGVEVEAGGGVRSLDDCARAVRRGRALRGARHRGDQGSGAGRGGVHALARANRRRGRRARGQGLRRGLDRDDRRRRRRRSARRSRAPARRPSSTPTSRATACAAVRTWMRRGGWRARLLPCPVIASGGVSRLEDLDALAPTGAAAVVVGKALYEKVFTVERGGRARVRALSASRAMLCKRVIPCLDVDAGRVKKGVRFKELRDAGDPVAVAAAYDAQGADEVCFLDITASSDGRKHDARRRARHRRARLPAAHRRRRRALGRGRARAACSPAPTRSASTRPPSPIRSWCAAPPTRSATRRSSSPSTPAASRPPRASRRAGRCSRTAAAARPASTPSPGASGWRRWARARSC